MVEVNFYDNVDDSQLKFAVIIAKTEGKWVFCKHRERDTFEVTGKSRKQRIYINMDLLKRGKHWKREL